MPSPQQGGEPDHEGYRDRQGAGRQVEAGCSLPNPCSTQSASLDSIACQRLIPGLPDLFSGVWQLSEEERQEWNAKSKANAGYPHLPSPFILASPPLPTPQSALFLLLDAACVTSPLFPPSTLLLDRAYRSISECIFTQERDGETKTHTSRRYDGVNPHRGER